MRSMVNTREQERDALLNLARGCGYVGHWTCVSRNAGTALQIDASSKEARRLAMLATQETALQSLPSTDAEAGSTRQSELRELMAHH